MELKDTVAMMLSDDYRERLVAEYKQVKIRYDKLDELIIRYLAGKKLPSYIKCPIDILIEQKTHMEQYMKYLRIRAEIEDIDIYNGVDKLSY